MNSDLFKCKPTMLEYLQNDIFNLERRIQLGFQNRRYSIHRLDSDFQESQRLDFERLDLKRSELDFILESKKLLINHK